MKYLKLSAAFVDLFAILFIFARYQFILALILMNPSKQEAPTPEPRAEIIINATWNNSFNSDVDSWLTREGQEICGYNRKEQGHLILANDWVNSNYGSVDGVKAKTARETITINAKAAGTYKFSLYGWRIHEDTLVHVTIEKTQPYKLLFDGEINVEHVKEAPVIEFDMDSDGKITNKITDEDLLEGFLRTKEGVLAR